MQIDIQQHPETRNKMLKISDQEYKQEITKVYQKHMSLANREITALKGGMNADQLLEQMMLPEERLLEKAPLYGARLIKIDADTSVEYETRYGIECILTDKRMILIDVDVDQTPSINKQYLPQSSFEVIDQNRVGHQIKESLYYQPIQFKNINSIVIDIHNSSYSSAVVQRTRNVGAVVIAALITFFLFFLGMEDENLMLLSLLGVVGTMAIAYMIKNTKILRDELILEHFRSIRLGLIDPETLKKSIWIIVVDMNFPPKQLVLWASTLQSKCDNMVAQGESQTIIVP